MKRFVSTAAGLREVPSRYKTKVLTEKEDVGAVVDVFVRSFLRNPFHIHRRTQEASIRSYFSAIVPVFAKAEQSILAYDAETDKPVGCLLNVDYTHDFVTKSEHHYTPARSDILALVWFCEEWYNREIMKKSTFTKGEVFLLEAVGVQPELHGNGIGQQMIRDAVVLAKDQGYERAFFLSVNNISTHNFKKNGFTLLKNVDYDTFVDEGGRRPFAGIKQMFPLEQFGIMQNVFSKK